jgi:hypothetical protein
MWSLKYWKARAASRIFNYLWQDPESGLAGIIEKNANARALAAIMSWLDIRHIRHCKYCIKVDEEPLKQLKGEWFCAMHFMIASKNLEHQAQPVQEAPPKLVIAR